MTKRIKNCSILTIIGKPYKIPSRDDDGGFIWEDESRGIAQDEAATVWTLIRHLLLSIPRHMQAQNDGYYSSAMWNSLLASEKTSTLAVEHLESDGYIELHDKTYVWLHRVLARKVPLTKEQKDSGQLERTLAVEFFSTSDYVIQEQLRDETDKGKLTIESVADP